MPFMQLNMDDNCIFCINIISPFLIAYGWVYCEDLKSKFSNKCQTKKEQER